MAAGLGFKDFQTGEVLTAADVDGYLMQGVWVFASATARDAAVTSPQEGNFAYLKDTNVTTYYTGSAWANLDTTGMTNPMTTTGDTIYSSSGSTPARLGIGTAGQILTVNSGATAPEWATPAAGGFVGCSLYNSASQSISNNTLTAITYNSENFDTDSFHDTSSNTSRITIPSGKGGKYQINFMTNGDGGYAGIWETFVYKNGSSILGAFSVPSLTSPYNFGACPIFTGVLDLAVADYIEIFIRQTSGTSKSIYNNGGGGFLDATYLGA